MKKKIFEAGKFPGSIRRDFVLICFPGRLKGRAGARGAMSVIRQSCIGDENDKT
ncbi:MAG TPA: hypothetical protein VFM25_02785 [Verrucomicrobiae bacterium]|nr:hypothetical protein [Verrucomicrobiae bacterium]